MEPMGLFLVCCSLIVIVCIICYTKYKIDTKNNDVFQDLNRGIRNLNDKFDDHMYEIDKLNEKVQEIVSYIREDKLF